jgi:hypothetical protein
LYSDTDLPVQTSMKKRLGLLLLLVSVLCAGCKKQAAKEEVIPNEYPAEYYPDGTPKFLKALSVPGSSSVSFDSLRGDFTIKMPDNYTSDQIQLVLSLYGGIQLLDSASARTDDKNIDFSYKGREPLRFGLQEPKGNKKFYTVYVEVPGTPVIELLSTTVPVSSGPFQLPIKIISGLGTTPAYPGQTNPSARFVDRKSSFQVDGTFYNNLIYANIKDAASLINTRTLALELTFDGNKKVTFENITFKRGLPKAELGGYENIAIPKIDSIRAYGGYYSALDRYTVQFSNDFLAKPIVRNMKYKDSLQIVSDIPQDIPEGSYLVTFYENEKIIGKNTVYFASEKTHSIETIWRGTPEQALIRNTNPLNFSKGDIFYAKQWPPKYANATSGFSELELPQVRLRNGSVVVDLPPKLVTVHWAVAGLTFSIGRYELPGNMQQGSYQATLVFPDKNESKPYWSKIVVQ